MANANVGTSNPYPGLRPFKERDSDDFFGRDDDVVALLSRVLEKRFLALLGGSGTGKSSVVRAGFISALRTEIIRTRSDDPTKQHPPGWRIADMRPGGEPIHQLAVALSGQSVLGEHQPGGSLESIEALLRWGPLGLIEAARAAYLPAQTRLMVLVDQFEELFRFQQTSSHLAADSDEVEAFTDLLLAASSQSDVPIYVVITMRSEYLGHCARYPLMASAITDGLYLLAAMTRDQMRAAIIEPATRRNVDMAEPLVSRLLNDVGGHSDQVPMLQHTLMRLWARRPEGSSRLDLTDLGDLRPTTSIGDHAEQIYAGLGDTEKRVAEYVFRNITSLVGENETIRNPAELHSIVERVKAALVADGLSITRDDVLRVVDVFRAEGCSMLMAAEPLGDNTVIDISHESLIRQWKRLKDWAQEHAEDLRPYLLLAEDAALWERKNKSDGWLSQGQRLADAIRWTSKNPDRLNALEAEFLERSRGDLSAGWIEKYQTYLARAKAWDQGRRSDLLLQKRELEDAEAWLGDERPRQHLKATALQRELIRVSRNEANAKGKFWFWTTAGSIAIALLAAFGLWMAAHFALQSYSRELARASVSEPDAATALSIATYALRASATPHATHAVHTALARSHLLRLMDLPRNYGNEPIASLISADGNSFAVKYRGGSVVVGTIDNASDGQSNLKVAHTDPAERAQLSLSKDGRTFASMTADGTVEVRNVADLTSARRYSTDTHDPTALALSGDGKMLVVGDKQGQFRIFSLRTTQSPTVVLLMTGSLSPRGAMPDKTPDERPLDIVALDFNADGTCVVAGDKRGRLRVFPVGKAACVTPRQNDDGATGLVTGSNTFLGNADAFVGDKLFPPISGLLFGSDKNVLAATTSNRAVYVYDLSKPDAKPVALISKGFASVTSVSLSKSFVGQSSNCRGGLDGLLAVSWDDGKIVRYKVCGDGPPAEEVIGSHPGPALAVSFVGTTQRLLSLGQDGTVRIWGSTGTEVATHEISSRPLDVAFIDSDGASELAIVTGPRTLRRCSLPSGSPIGSEPAQSNAATCQSVTVPNASELQISKRTGSYVVLDDAKSDVTWQSLLASPTATRDHTKVVAASLIAVASTGQYALVAFDAGKARRVQVIARSGREAAWALPQDYDWTKWRFVLSADGASVFGYPLEEIAVTSGPHSKAGPGHFVIWSKNKPLEPEPLPATADVKPISVIAVSDDGKWLATGHFDGTVTLWGVAERKRLRVENYAPSRLFGVPDAGLPPFVSALVFDPDGNFLAVGSSSGIRVVNVKTNEISTAVSIDSHSGPNFAGNLAFSKGNKLAAAVGENSVQVYDLDSTRLLAIARRQIQSQLNEKDCLDYLSRTCEQTDFGKLFWWVLEIGAHVLP